ncbi:MAG: helix-turn-helix transcriptional regulator [Clostridiales bacterium]|nr:helix-turn-helix transcriptional regulator [Clostridiales bacterium]
MSSTLKIFLIKYFVMTIGDRIKELRKEKNFSQSQLARRIGVSQKAVDYWELGTNEPKASYIVKLAELFEVSADFLLGIDD